MKAYKMQLSGILVIAFLVMSGFISLEDDEKVKATGWNIDKDHSNLSFEITHFFTPVTGTFQKYTSEIYFDPAKLDESSIKVDVMVASIDTDNEKRDGHLQSDDFFNAKKYPKMTFKSDKITKTGDNKFVAHGKLTIKDVTKDIGLPFTLLGMKDHPMKDGVKIAGLKASYSLDRTDYDVGVGDWAATAVVGDEVDINIALELNSTQ